MEYTVLSLWKDTNFELAKKWVHHYFEKGFDKIVIGNNGLSDELLSWLKSWTGEKKIEVIDYTNIEKNEKEDKNSYKGADIITTFFTMYFKDINPDGWTLVLDDDEFIEFGIYKTVSGVVKNFPKDTCSVCFPWIHYISNKLEYDTDFDNYTPMYHQFGSVKTLYNNKYNKGGMIGCHYNFSVSMTMNYRDQEMHKKIYDMLIDKLDGNFGEWKSKIDKCYVCSRELWTGQTSIILNDMNLKFGYNKHYMCRGYQSFIDKINRGFSAFSVTYNDDNALKSKNYISKCMTDILDTYAFRNADIFSIMNVEWDKILADNFDLFSSKIGYKFIHFEGGDQTSEINSVIALLMNPNVDTIETDCKNKTLNSIFFIESLRQKKTYIY
jgi:hypothetical protein